MPKPSNEPPSSLFDRVEPANAPQQEPRVTSLTVTSLTKAIRDTLESRFMDVTVEGEISNFTNHRSGHRYWTLKDEGAQMSCVFWKTRQVSFELKEGMKIVARGRISVYAPRGNYQLDVFQVRPLGIGALQAAYEALFKKLSEEGLFEQGRKRDIPRFPKKIGIVTSSTGAALHDMLTVLRRRYPVAEVLFRAASVQGVGAELDVARAIIEMNLIPEAERPDVLIVGRGGGSLEDLWTFNEEAVARAIFSSQIPVVSAVGHEVDVTIADFVADLRAPTPTAAAELITPNRSELLSSISASASTLDYFMKRTLADLRASLQSHSSGYGLKRVLAQALTEKNTNVVHFTSRMNSNISHFLELAMARSERFQSTLRALNPYAVLDRGYAIVQNEQGSVITKVDQVKGDSQLDVVLSDGRFRVRRTP